MGKLEYDWAVTLEWNIVCEDISAIVSDHRIVRKFNISGSNSELHVLADAYAKYHGAVGYFVSGGHVAFVKAIFTLQYKIPSVASIRANCLEHSCSSY